jgi:hypothetical protein
MTCGALNRRTASLRVAAALALALVSMPALAEINSADTLEWATADSDVVARAVITAVVPSKSGCEATVRVVEFIKGTSGSTLRVAFPRTCQNGLDAWRSGEANLLLFLVEVEGAKPSFALRRGWGEMAIELGKTKAYTVSLTVLVKEADVLAATRSAAGSTAKVSHTLDVPTSSAAFRDLSRGSSVELRVPVHAALEHRAIAWLVSDESDLRREGVRALANFRSLANIRRLKQLLADPSVSVTKAPGMTVRRYFVRASADGVLTEWKVPHVTPVLEATEPRPSLPAEIVLMDLRSMIGGSFAEDHLGPEEYRVILARARAQPAVYLTTLVDDVVGSGPDAKFLASAHIPQAVQLLAEAAPEEAASTAKRLLVIHESALREAGAEAERLRERIAQLRWLAGGHL